MNDMKNLIICNNVFGTRYAVLMAAFLIVTHFQRNWTSFLAPVINKLDTSINKYDGHLEQFE